MRNRWSASALRGKISRKFARAHYLHRLDILRPIHRAFERIFKSPFFYFLAIRVRYVRRIICKINEHGICIFNEQGRVGSKLRIRGTKPMKILENKSKFAVLAAAPLMAVALTLAVGTLTQQAVATPPSGGGPAGNSNNAFAVGGITVVSGHVAFAAHRNPNNGNINGHVVQDITGTSISGPVTCLFVSSDGKSARIGWTVTSSDNTMMYPIGQTRQFDVTDNGEPVMGMSPDGYTDVGPCMNNCNNTMCPSDCGCCTTNGGMTGMIIHGNIVVRGPM